MGEVETWSIVVVADVVVFVPDDDDDDDGHFRSPNAPRQ
jgi:hypothetical protein